MTATGAGEPAARSPSWRVLGAADLPALAALAARCLAADGGQPFAAEPAFVGRSYLSAGRAVGYFVGTSLACASVLRPAATVTRPVAPAGAVVVTADGTDPPAGATTEANAGQQADARVATTTGMVDPQWRRRGIGGRALDWALALAGDAPARAETEALCDGAHALYLTRGFVQTLAEDVMQLPAGREAPPVRRPNGLALADWTQADASRFFAVYESAFSERPGFPSFTRAEWIDWISQDPDFRPDWTLLAVLDGADAGFIAGELSGWIAQVGVVPRARGAAVGASLIVEVVERMRAAGESSVTLNVNVNNPRAAALYRRLGFDRIGRRARYRREHP